MWREAFAPTHANLQSAGQAASHPSFADAVEPARVLRAGGSERPLFAIVQTASEAELSRVARLVERLEAGNAMYALMCEPIAPHGPRTLHGLAAGLVEHVRELQPHGPYRLLGWSLGGLVAYEMACQLIGVDASIEFVGLIESDHLSGAARRAAWSKLETKVPSSPVRSLQRMALEYEAPRSRLTVELFVDSHAAGLEVRRGWDAILPAEHVRIVRVPELAVSARSGSQPAPLAARISAALREPLAAQSLPELEYAALHTIAHGQRTRAAYYCVPGAGAGLTDFLPLAAALGPEPSVFGFQARGLDGVLLPHTTVQAAAGCYLRELLSLRPNSELHLVGHSFGGWVSFEMALQLQAAGRPPASLTVLDSSVPGASHRIGREYTRVEALLELIQLYENAAERSLGIRRADLEQRDCEAQLVHIHARLAGVGLLPARSRAKVLEGPVRSFEAALRTQYRPSGVLMCPVRLLFVPLLGEPEDATQRRVAALVEGWRTFAPELRWQRGAGNHVSMLKAPHVSAIASFICDCAPSLDTHDE